MNPSKRRKEIEAMVKRAGLTIMEYSYTGGGHIGILVEAENGTQRRFSISHASGDFRADKNNESTLRRFARENLSTEKPAQQAENKQHDIAPPPAAPAQQPEPVTTTTTAPTMTTKPTIKKRQTTHVEFFQICEWIKNAELGGIFTLAQCAEKASAALGFSVPHSAIDSAIKATGVKLPDRPDHSGKRDRTQILAKELVDLLRHLGQTPSADLMSIVNRTGG